MVYVLLADGFEEIEAIEPIDILRRGGVSVKTVGVNGKRVVGAHGIAVEADILINEALAENIELLMLPGGPGHTNIEESEPAMSLIKNAYEKGMLISAICASPSILGKAGMLNNKKAVCFPGYEKFLYGAEYSEEKAVRDGSIITGKGAGAAAEFGFLMLEALKGKKCAEEIRSAMQY